MKRNIFLLVFFALAACGISYGQSGIGYDYYRIGEYESAQKYYTQILTQSPAEANFFLGEIAFAQENYDQARNYYNAGLAADANNPLNQIGLAKLTLRTNQKDGESELRSIQRKNRKNVTALVNIGYAYLDNGMYDKAREIVTEARKANSNAPDVYVLEGDIQRITEANNLGNAAAKYEAAIQFDGNYRLAYLKYADVYSRLNPNVAVEKLKQVIDKYPDYWIAYRNLGIIYRNNGYYSQAVEALKKYFDAGIYNFRDISEYVYALYFNKNYDEALVWLNQGLSIEPNNFILNRLRMYIASQTEDYQNGLQYARDFFAIDKGPARSYIPDDFIEYSNILRGLGMYDEAIAEGKNALEILENRTERETIYRNMIDIAAKNKKDNGQAAGFYAQMVDEKGTDATLADYTYVGIYYYNAGRVRNDADRQIIANRMNEPEFVEKVAANSGVSSSELLADRDLFVKNATTYYLDEGDKIFDRLVETSPGSYVGYQWKARINSLRDPDFALGTAKPYYEETIAKIETGSGERSDSEKSALTESYLYLASYYYTKQDMKKSSEYSNKVLEINPNNAQAKALLDYVKQHQQQMEEYQRQLQQQQQQQ